MLFKYSRFVGGSTFSEAVATSGDIYTRHGWFSIVDYAKEGSQNKKDVMNVIDTIKHASYSPCMTQPAAYAVKLSSFLPFKPEHTIPYAVDILRTRYNAICFDAETNDTITQERMIARDLIRTFNHADAYPIIYKTYQMYRYDSFTELVKDIHDFASSGLGVKLVRGAHYHIDASTGKLHASKRDTDYWYDRAVMYVLESISRGYNLHVIIATHNEYSVANAIRHATKLSIPKHRIRFAQLLGMNDNLSAFSTQLGFVTYKYVPYGSYRDSIPYLLRRWYENYDIIKYMR